MRILVIITTILAAQVSASFYDVFNGAVLSVQSTFGQLLSDVITDVTVTVDCTILAVEHVLSLTPDATTRYNEKCGSATNKTVSVSNAQQDKSLPNVEVAINLPNNEEYLEKKIPVEIVAKVNETLSKVLTSNNNVLSVKNEMANKSGQLTGVSDLVKKEMEKLSNEVTTDLKNIEQQRVSKPSVDAILQEIKVLEKKEENTNNTSESYEIHQIIDKILGKLDAIEAIEATEHIKLEEILKKMEKYSNNSSIGLRDQFEEWKKEEYRHLGDIEDQEKISDHLDVNNKDASKDMQPIITKTELNGDGVEYTLDSQELSDVNITQVKEILNSSTSPSTIGNSNKQPSISVGNETSFSQNSTLKESEPNNTVIISTSCSATESPTAFDSGELPNLSINQSTTPQTPVEDTNETIANTTLPITDGGPINETIQPADNTKESTSVTTNKPTTTLSTNENISTETVIIINPLPETGILLDVISQLVPAENNTDSRIDEDLATNNDTVFTSATGAETELISTAQDSVINDNANDTAVPSISNTMLENTPVIAIDSENFETSTLTIDEFTTTSASFEDTQSNDTMITRSSTSKNVSISLNETNPTIDTSVFTANEEFSTVPTKILGDNDSNTSSIIENTSVNETIRTEETTAASDNEESLTGKIKIVDDNDSDDAIIASSSSPIIECTTVIETIEETSPTLDDEETKTILINDDYSNMTMFNSDSLPIVETTTVSETIESEKTTTATGSENSSNDSNYTMIESTSLSTAESSPAGDVSQAETVTSFESLIETAIELPNNSYNVKDSSDYNINTSEDESFSLAVNNLTETSNTTDDTNITALTISESISKENITTAENEEPLLMSTNSTTVSTTTLIDTDSNSDTITSTLFPPSEITTATEIAEPVESITSGEDTYDDINANDEVTMFTSDSSPIVETAPVSDTIEPEETTTACGNENSSNDSNDEMIESTSLSTAETMPLSDASQAETTTSFESLLETAMELPNNLKDSGDYIINTTTTPIINNNETEIIEAMDTDSTSEDESLSSAVNNPTETPNTTDDTNVTALTISESISQKNITTADENEEPLLMSTNSTTVSTTTLINTDPNSDTTTGTLFPPSEIITATEIVELVGSITSPGNEEPITINSPETVKNAEVTNDDINTNDEMTNTTVPNADSETATETIEAIVASEEQMSLTSTSAVNETVTTSTVCPSTECIALSETLTPVENIMVSNSEEGLPSSNQTSELLINPEIPYEIPLYGQTVMPPITSGLSNDDSKLLTADTLIPNDPDQKTKLENDALKQAAFDAFDSIHERLLHSELPFGSEEDILKITSTPLVTIAPKLNLNYPSNMPSSTRQPTTSATSDKPPSEVLTTHTPTNTAGPANNDETPPEGYNSFFQTPAKDSELHQLVVKEARQIIANSKRSARIINKIMKNKNKHKN